jgi:hypothetical protein
MLPNTKPQHGEKITFTYSGGNISTVKQKNTAGLTTLANYKYNGLGQVIERTDSNSGLPNIRFYYGDSGQVLEEIKTSDETPYRWYVWGSQGANDLVARGPTYVQYSIADASGSVVTRYDHNSNSVVARHVYDGYGTPSQLSATWSLQSITEDLQLYQGQRWMKDHAQYLLARNGIYDSSIWSIVSRANGTREPAAVPLDIMAPPVDSVANYGPLELNSGPPCCTLVLIEEAMEKEYDYDRQGNKGTGTEEARRMNPGAGTYSDVSEFIKKIKCPHPSQGIKKLTIIGHGNVDRISTGNSVTGRSPLGRITDKDTSWLENAFAYHKFCHPCDIVLAGCRIGRGAIPSMVAIISGCQVQSWTGGVSGAQSADNIQGEGEVICFPNGECSEL